jgi:preprotein translocase subunit SecE
MQKISKFFFEVKTELQKATWPWDPKEKGFKKYKELTDSTVVVFIAMILLGAFVSFWDLILSKVMGLVTMGA